MDDDSMDGTNNNNCYYSRICMHAWKSRKCFVFFFSFSLLFVGTLTTNICLIVFSRQNFLFGICIMLSSRRNAGAGIYMRANERTYHTPAAILLERKKKKGKIERRM